MAKQVHTKAGFIDALTYTLREHQLNTIRDFENEFSQKRQQSTPAGFYEFLKLEEVELLKRPEITPSLPYLTPESTAEIVALLLENENAEQGNEPINWNDVFVRVLRPSIPDETILRFYKEVAVRNRISLVKKLLEEIEAEQKTPEPKVYPLKELKDTIKQVKEAFRPFEVLFNDAIKNAREELNGPDEQTPPDIPTELERPAQKAYTQKQYAIYYKILIEKDLYPNIDSAERTKDEMCKEIGARHSISPNNFEQTYNRTKINDATKKDLINILEMFDKQKHAPAIDYTNDLFRVLQAKDVRK